MWQRRPSQCDATAADALRLRGVLQAKPTRVATWNRDNTIVLPFPLQFFRKFSLRVYLCATDETAPLGETTFWFRDLIHKIDPTLGLDTVIAQQLGALDAAAAPADAAAPSSSSSSSADAPASARSDTSSAVDGEAAAGVGSDSGDSGAVNAGAAAGAGDSSAATSAAAAGPASASASAPTAVPAPVPAPAPARPARRLSLPSSRVTSQQREQRWPMFDASGSLIRGTVAVVAALQPLEAPKKKPPSLGLLLVRVLKWSPPSQTADATPAPPRVVVRAQLLLRRRAVSIAASWACAIRVPMLSLPCHWPSCAHIVAPRLVRVRVRVLCRSRRRTSCWRRAARPAPP